MTSSPYVPCYETAANGIRSERTRLMRWPIKAQALCREHLPVVERIPLAPTVGSDLRKRRSAQRFRQLADTDEVYPDRLKEFCGVG